MCCSLHLRHYPQQRTLRLRSLGEQRSGHTPAVHRRPAPHQRTRLWLGGYQRPRLACSGADHFAQPPPLHRGAPGRQAGLTQPGPSAQGGRGGRDPTPPFSRTLGGGSLGWSVPVRRSRSPLFRWDNHVHSCVQGRLNHSQHSPSRSMIAALAQYHPGHQGQQLHGGSQPKSGPAWEGTLWLRPARTPGLCAPVDPASRPGPLGRHNPHAALLSPTLGSIDRQGVCTHRVLVSGLDAFSR